MTLSDMTDTVHREYLQAGDGASAADPVRPQCPVCKSQNTQHLCQVDGYDIWRCPESATDFVWPMPTASALKELYDREAWFEGGERGGYSDYDAQTESSLPLVEEILQRFTGSDKALAVLDIGCGYGSHLRLAADHGWDCFGVEPSLHARTTAQQRHGDRITVVERAEDLLPKRFDLVLMLEVIEHLANPFDLFFTLFGRDVIGPETLVVISTPNARSSQAIRDPAKWAYRHPPSHLVYYSAKSLHSVLSRLMFTEVTTQGIVAQASESTARFDDEAPSVNDETGSFLGILAEARGSNFKEFMHERYVPGAFWKLTEYEHFPRYAMATLFAQGQRVLDFGCGTGYGTARLATVAQTVVGMDISSEAIHWARAMHRNPRIKFEVRSDLGSGFDAGSFDLVTCFEMIEHVDHATQIAAIESISHLLTPSGKLIISTPDPQFTAPYGENPYHLREMTEPEFRQLLEANFPHVVILKQWVLPSVFIGSELAQGQQVAHISALSAQGDAEPPVGFVAVCSQQPIASMPMLCQVDSSSDFNRQTLETEHKLNRLRFDNFKLLNSKRWQESQCQSWEQLANEREQAITLLHTQLQELSSSNAWLSSQRDAWEKLAKEHEQSIQWFSSQRDAWGKLAKEHEQSIQWFSSQRDAWETLAKEHERSVNQLQSHAQELSDANTALTAQRDAWEALATQRGTVLARIRGHWALRFVNFLFRGRLLGD